MKRLSIWFEICQVSLWLWYLKGGRVLIPNSGPKWNMGMGQFWVQESAVGHKWSNFQPFCFKFGLCTWFEDISTCKTENTFLRPICAPFGVMTIFGSIFFSQIFFFPNFFYSNFFLPKFFFAQFFFFIFFLKPN